MGSSVGKVFIVGDLHDIFVLSECPIEAAQMQTCIKRRDGRDREFNRVWDLATSYPSSSVGVANEKVVFGFGYI